MKTAATDNLQKIEHVVVLMMENRSFDQMLGYLQEDGLGEVDGLAEAKPNFDSAGNKYEPFAWEPGETAPMPPPGYTAKILDPCHSPGCVKAQLANDNTGFVKDFEKTRGEVDGVAVKLGPEHLRVPMGHYTAEHLPTYDLLARGYCVCDSWHASIPGNTWPNRLYSVAGREVDPATDGPTRLQRLLKWLGRARPLSALADAPIFDLPAFTHQLDTSHWRWYSHDPATLRAVDGAYRTFHFHRENFAYFDRKKMSVRTEAAEGAIVDLHDSFLDDAANGTLRSVSWIDPNFVDLKLLDPNSNDDHPPSDVHAGQALVLETYEALVNSKAWENTLLVIVYDEHGGFYDHVPAPATQTGDPSQYATWGPRVPALLVGPRVRNGVCKAAFEHTTLLATILRRFAADPAKALAAMPWRVQRASHLGSVLLDGPRPEALDREALQAQIEEVRAKLDAHRTAARQRRRAVAGERAEDPDGGAGHPQVLMDWQEEFLGAALRLRQEGLPPGQP